VRLARAAAGGNARAFATLYDRYEQRVFNLAFRITGSRDHSAQVTREAFLDALLALPHREGGESAFGSGVLTAARNAAYELLEQRPEASAVIDPPAESDPPERPDRDPLLEAEQDRIREAGLRLSEPEREVLALGSLNGLSYAETAAIMDVESDSVPPLVARARISLHDELSGSNLASAPSPYEDCDQVLPLMAMRDDGRLEDEEDAQWVLDHLAHCGDCRVRLDAMQQAATAYEGWEPAVAPPALFQETMAAAAESGSVNWSETTREWVAERSSARPRCSPGRGRAKSAQAALVPAVTHTSGAVTETLDSLRGVASGLASRAWGRRPPRNPVVTTGLVCLTLLGLAAVAAGATLILHSDDRSGPAARSGAEVDTPVNQAPAYVQSPDPRPRTGFTAKPEKPRTAPQTVPIAPQRVVAVGAPPVVPARPKSTPNTESPRAKTPRRTPQAKTVPIPKPSPPVSQPAPTSPPAETTPQQPQPTGCTDATGNPVPCPG